MTYFGPYSADVLNQRLPVDHLLFATVEAGDAAVKSNTEANTPSGSVHANGGSSHGAPAKPRKASKRRSFQRGVSGMKPVDSVVGALTELARQEEEEAEGEDGDGELSGGEGDGDRRSSASRRGSHAEKKVSVVTGRGRGRVDEVGGVTEFAFQAVVKCGLGRGCSRAYRRDVLPQCTVWILCSAHAGSWSPRPADSGACRCGFGQERASVAK
jgi:hypothetical protein